MTTRSNRALAWGMGLIFAFILLQKVFITYTDYLWYQSLGQAAVFSTILGHRFLLFLVFGGVFFAWMWGNLRYARQPVPSGLKLIGKRLLPDEERAQIEQFADKGLLWFAVIAAFLAGMVASGKWRELLQFTHLVPFGENDAVFGRDLGFYVFRLAFLNYVAQSAFFGIVLAFVISTVVHIYQEALRLVGNTVHATPRARCHLLGLLALALLVKAYLYRLAQYGLLYSGRGEEFFGPGYADIHGRLPVLFALIAVSIIAAIVMLVSIKGKGHKVPAAALVGVLLVAILGGWLYPALLQSLVVKPNQLDKERTYITNNITATLKAYNLDAVSRSRHAVKEDLGWDAIRANRPTVDNIRLWDHRPLQTTYQQTQALRSYYHFADVDVDRYTVQGQYRQVMLSARQLNYAGINNPNWVSQHLLYTHGYGLCLSPVNEIAGDGLPRYWVKDFPVTSDVGFKVTRPQLYYYASTHPRLIEYISPPESPADMGPDAGAAEPPGPGGPGGGPEGPAGPGGPGGPGGRGRPKAAPRGPAVQDIPYVVVNTKEKELDFPQGDSQAGTDALTANATHQYQGQGDVQLSSAWRRFCFFMRYRDLRLLLTDSIKPDSRILFNRTLPERLVTLAPILGYDPDPYLVVAGDGKLKWMNDAYTATNMYPYAARVPWFGANYVRNSVKVVMDAYDGVPEFYVMPPGKNGKADPVVQSWRSIFPSLFKDYAQMDPVLQKHLRYPQLLFRIQAEIYTKYHMTDPQTFFQKEDQWAIPPEVYSKGQREVESYYVNMHLPGTKITAEEEFLLMLPFTLAKREDKNMVAWMAARCDEPNYGELIVYDFPKSSLVLGPMQVESRISQDAEISQLITLWGQQQSQIIRGNLLVIPIADSLLYVEPFYLEAPNSPLPQLKLIVLAYDDKIVSGPTLEDALRRLFGLAGSESASSATASRPPTQPLLSSANLKQLLLQALQLDQQAQQALAKGDLAGYQSKQQEQSQVIERASKLAR